MNYKYYIQNCVDNFDNEELVICWNLLGEKVANDSVKIYTKDSLYKITDENSKFNNYLFWCDSDYIGKINWSNIKVLQEAGKTALENGITSNCFTFFNIPLDTTHYNEIIEINKNTTPFSKYSEQKLLTNADIIIDDTTYYQIMQVVGQPFIKDSELEYNRQAILKLTVEPALRTYFKYFPLFEEAQYSISGNYDIKYPEMAYRAIGWVTQAGISSNISPLAALGSRAIIQGGVRSVTNQWTNIQYSKPVPGWTGRGESGNSISEMSQTYPLINTLRNMSKREKLSKIKKDDGLHAIGYTTVGGTLNVVWFKWSRDWDDTDFEDYDELLRLCQANVKINIGTIRSLLKTDNNIPFDATTMKTEGKTEYDSIIKDWKDSPYNKIFTPMRGGMI